MDAGAASTEDGADAETATVEELRRGLEELASTVDDRDERRAVRRALRLLEEFPEKAGGIRKCTRRDVAESFVGSILVSLPLLVEDGVFEIAVYLLSDLRLLALDLLFLLGTTIGLLYAADFRELTVTRPLFGVIPRRLVSVLVVSFLTAAFMMTLWGRLESWSDPGGALSRVVVVWTVAAFGAALGDILPGESSAPDINDELDDIGERIGIGDDEGRV